MRNASPVQTASLLVHTLCVPCGCHCRYCLLRWDGRLTGADYARCEAYARRFCQWISRERPDLSFHFAFGYSMEHPRLTEALAFLRSIGSVSGEFLQMDGMRMRSAGECDLLMAQLQSSGVKHVNFTFYGTEAYHDAFAGRKGDHALLLRMAQSALQNGLEVSAGLPLNRENAGQADCLAEQLQDIGIARLSAFIPHAEGRGAALESIRFAQADYEALPDRVQGLINTAAYRSEAQWLQTGLKPDTHRMLLLSLTPDNIDHFERLDFADAIREIEALDDAYYGALPPASELACRYGDASNSAWYSQRDLLDHYRKRFIREKGLLLYDITDERQSGSRRYCR